MGCSSSKTPKVTPGDSGLQPMADPHTEIINAIKQAKAEKRESITFVGTMPTETENELKRLNYKIVSFFEQDPDLHVVRQRFTVSWTSSIVIL